MAGSSGALPDGRYRFFTIIAALSRAVAGVAAARLPVSSRAMFLFTAPPAPVRDTAPASPIVDAIRQGAEGTGTGFDYLLATAQRESALDPAARARSSSASGLFQFIEQ